MFLTYRKYGYIIKDNNMATNILAYLPREILRQGNPPDNHSVGDGTIAGIMAERYVSQK
jgi:putative component of toxin-antitoxin plasmid stabilization module